MRHADQPMEIGGIALLRLFAQSFHFDPGEARSISKIWIGRAHIAAHFVSEEHLGID